MKNWAKKERKHKFTEQSIPGSAFFEIKVHRVNWYEGHQIKHCNVKVPLMCSECAEQLRSSPAILSLYLLVFHPKPFINTHYNSLSYLQQNVLKIKVIFFFKLK